MSTHFFPQYKDILAVTSTRESGPMGGSKNPGPNGEFFRNSIKFLSGFGIDAKERLVRAGLVHGSAVRWVQRPPIEEEVTGSDGFAAKVRRIANVDGLVTYNPEVVLGIVTSDCYPIFLYYPVPSSMAPCGIIGLAHAGRAGVMLKIANVAVESMYLAGARKLGELRVAIGPGICAKCHTLHRRRDEADVAFFEMGYPDSMNLAESDPEMVGVDLIDVIRRQLIQAGIANRNIEISGECTACPENREKFFSHRRDMGQEGRSRNMLSVMGFRRRGT